MWICLDIFMWIYCGQLQHHQQIHSRSAPALLTFDVCAWANAIVNHILWPCAHSFPLLPIWFSRFGGRYSLDGSIESSSNPFKIYHSNRICLLSSQIQTSRCNIVDKTLLSTVLLNRGKLGSFAFIHDSNPIKCFRWKFQHNCPFKWNPCNVSHFHINKPSLALYRSKLGYMIFFFFFFYKIETKM